MQKLQIPFTIFIFVIALGLAIVLQGVLGINIGSTLNPINFFNNLNLNQFQIKNVGEPFDAKDAATKGFVDSVVVAKALYGHCQYRYEFPASSNRCFAKAPAFCDPAVTYGNNCTCPAGYEFVVTGVWNPFLVTSCYKL